MKKVLTLWILIACGTFTMAQDVPVVYPVSVSNVQAGVQQNETVLRWSTVCYVSFAKFEIQKSSNGINYTTIHAFSADRLRCQQPFTYSDAIARNDGALYYRIKVGDRDGSFYQSKVVTVVRNTASNEIKAFPTVVNSSVSLSLSTQTDQAITLKLLNPAGVLAKQFRYSISRGVNSFTLDVSGLSNGMYWITYNDASGLHSTRFIKN